MHGGRCILGNSTSALDHGTVAFRKRPACAPAITLPGRLATTTIGSIRVREPRVGWKDGPQQRQQIGNTAGGGEAPLSLANAPSKRLPACRAPSKLDPAHNTGYAASFIWHCIGSSKFIRGSDVASVLTSSLMLTLHTMHAALLPSAAHDMLQDFLP